jgi:Na+/proline symporter/signal transduction histidine kinase
MIDQIIIGLYLIITLIIGLLVGRNTHTISDFAIGKRNFSTIFLISTAFATVIDGGGTVGLAETVYSLGPIYCLSFLGIAVSYLALAFFIAPKFEPFLGLLSSGDILDQLYGTKAKIFMGFATIFESTMLIGMQVLAITHLMQYFFGLPPTIAACGSSIIILLYSFRGGIRAVTATDVFQFGMLIVAIPIMCSLVLHKIGGFDGLYTVIKSPPKEFEKIDYFKQLAIFISFSLPAIFPRTLQRMLMAKNTQQIRTTFIFNGLLCVPFYLIIGILGVSALILSPSLETNLIFPNLINEALPIGIKGFVIAGLLAVFMSSIDSDLNLSSIAITHDIVTPLLKSPISENVKLQIARLSSLFIAASSVLLALYFGNIMNMIYFLLCISNSAFFPGYLVGFLGLKPGKTGFWYGLIAASVSVISFTFVLDLFLLYTGLISISLNLAILIVFHFKENYSRQFIDSNIPLPIPPQELGIIQDKPEYSSVFGIFAMISGHIPFFVLPSNFKLKDQPYLVIYLLITIFSFLIIFREAWWKKAQRLFNPFLYLTIIMSLPCISFLMCLISNFYLLWIMDLAISFALLLTFTHKRSSLFLAIVGLLLASFIYSMLPITNYNDTHLLAYWSLISHVIALICCLFLFRKQDAQKYQSLSSKLAHEASRSLASLSLSAEFLKLKLPELVRCYEWAHQNGYSSRSINQKVINELEELPMQLQVMGERTNKTVASLLSRIYQNNKYTNNRSVVEIFSCVKDAVADPSIEPIQKAKIKINANNDFSFFGDHVHVTHVILNIIENALYAINTKNAGQIEIWANGHSLFIKDNGIGISKKNLPNIFDEFFSTKNTLGQGLAFCKQIMSEHNGMIQCESEENQFTQFELSFPEMEQKIC